MCGIFGIWQYENNPVDPSMLRRATETLRHRGPDDEGYLLVNTSNSKTVHCGGRDTPPELNLPRIETLGRDSADLALGFRRLSILDVSPAGHQPMRSADGHCWIILNGEIYNYLELRAELIACGHRFRTGTDTEVILAAYQQWGTECVPRFNGMWAFAIWDSRSMELFLARDRFGEKPLHYFLLPGKAFAFASEIKALHATGLVAPRVHEETLLRYKLYDQTDMGEQTFYENVWRLPQGHSLLVRSDGTISKRRYWDLDPRVRHPDKPEQWHAERFRELFFDSVRLRLRADVPVGSSLSGGLDSSTTVSVMDKLLPDGAVQKTFSARFDDSAKDEGKWIEQVTRVTRVEPHFVWPNGE